VCRLSFNQARNQLGTPGGRRFFWEGLKFFKPCTIFLTYVQHIFQGRRKIFQGRLCPPRPLVTDLHSNYVFTVDLTCFNEESVRDLTHVLYVLANVQRIFSAKSFSLGNLFADKFPEALYSLWYRYCCSPHFH